MKTMKKPYFYLDLMVKDKGSRSELWDVNITKILNSLSDSFSNRTGDIKILI